MQPNPTAYDVQLFDQLLKERIIFLGTEVTDKSANVICAQLLLLSAADPGSDLLSPALRSCSHEWRCRKALAGLDATQELLQRRDAIHLRSPFQLAPSSLTAHQRYIERHVEPARR